MDNKYTAEELNEKTVPQLRQLAHRETINLEGRDKKSDIVETILKALEARAAAEQPAENPPAGDDAAPPADEGSTPPADEPPATDETPPPPPASSAEKKKPAKEEKATADESILGSSVQPAVFKMADGTSVPLGKVVAEAHRRTRLTPEAWNELPDAAREAQISQVVQELETKGAGILLNDEGTKTPDEALLELLKFEHAVRATLAAQPVQLAHWNKAVLHAKRALAK
jgi:hypothetical protein